LGHPFDETNTYVKRGGARRCKICQRRRGNEYRLRNLEKLRKKCRDYHRKRKT
jgi:hypothetical protein